MYTEQDIKHIVKLAFAKTGNTDITSEFIETLLGEYEHILDSQATVLDSCKVAEKLEEVSDNKIIKEN